MPQVFSEPNKVDTQNKEIPVVDLDFFQNEGMEKLQEYITSNGVDDISSNEIKAIRGGKYILLLPKTK